MNAINNSAKSADVIVRMKNVGGNANGKPLSAAKLVKSFVEFAFQDYKSYDDSQEGVTAPEMLEKMVRVPWTVFKKADRFATEMRVGNSQFLEADLVDALPFLMRHAHQHGMEGSSFQGPNMTARVKYHGTSLCTLTLRWEGTWTHGRYLEVEILLDCLSSNYECHQLTLSWHSGDGKKEGSSLLGAWLKRVGALGDEHFLTEELPPL